MRVKEIQLPFPVTCAYCRKKTYHATKKKSITTGQDIYVCSTCKKLMIGVSS